MWITKTLIKAKVNKYKTRKEFYNKDRDLYLHANRNGWIDELFPKTQLQENKNKLEKIIDNIDSGLSDLKDNNQKISKESIIEFISNIKHEIRIAQNNLKG